jgi:hypothetical protein
MDVKIILILVVGLLFLWSVRSWYQRRKANTLFYTTIDYPEVKVVEDNWKSIAFELPPFDMTKKNQYPKRSRSAWNNEEAARELMNTKSIWMQGWQGDQVWYNFPLMYQNLVIDQADKICPKTIEILKHIPHVQIAGYSMLLPNSKLAPHTDLTGKKYGSMALNMPLTPIKDESAALYILDSVHKHKTGKAVIFDSTQTHWADNRSEKPRVILYIDFKTHV